MYVHNIYYINRCYILYVNRCYINLTKNSQSKKLFHISLYILCTYTYILYVYKIQREKLFENFL